MKEYANNAPAFSPTLRITETTDTDHADNINAAPIQAFENTLVLKALLDSVMGAARTQRLTIPTEGWREFQGGEEEPPQENSIEQESSMEQENSVEEGEISDREVQSGEGSEIESPAGGSQGGGSLEGEYEAGMWYRDILLDGITEAMIPVVSILPADAEAAKKCGMATTVRTFVGGLRVYAEQPPEKEIRTDLLLFQVPFGTGGSLGGGGSGGGNPDVGGNPGSSSEVATEEEVEEMFEEIFGGESGAYVSDIATEEEVGELLEQVFEEAN
ncbi:MAG: hypothetical protein HFI40_00655 [Lachnospiraceae bacterium]|jgi:hypothetical protein|nr:hypothetical protein [Lachnospiraceae bacterium]